MESGFLPRTAVGVLAALLATVLSLPPAWSQEPASWAGRVFQGDGVTPRSGVVVSLLDAEGQRAVRSSPTRDDGGFVIDRVPAGSYAVAVETEQGAFVSPDLLDLAPGVNQPVGLALRSGPIDAELPYGLGEPGGLSTLGQWLLAGSIFVLGIFALHQISESDSSPTATVSEPEPEED
jgi:hypothetical protein